MGPNTIYMQHDCDGDLSTWCAERINGSDTVYVQEQKLKLERMECVCRECLADPIKIRHRFYCASCGKPRAWPMGTTPLSRPEALAKARDDERQRCAAIIEQFTTEDHRDIVQRVALAILDEIRLQG